MKYEETYYGHRIVVTTTRNSGGRWTSSAEVVGEGAESTKPGDGGGGADFPSEDEARRAALSRAAGAIDRARQGQGKP